MDEHSSAAVATAAPIVALTLLLVVGAIALGARARTLTKARTYPDPVQKAHECTLHCHRVAGHVAACTVKDPGVARHVWASAAGARYQEAKLRRQLLVHAHGSCWHMLGRARDARIAGQGFVPTFCNQTRRTIQRQSSLDRPDTRDTRRSIELENCRVVAALSPVSSLCGVGAPRAE